MKSRQRVRRFLSRFIRDERGLEMMEWMLLGALLLVLIVGIWRFVGPKIWVKGCEMSQAIDGQLPPGCKELPTSSL